MFKSIRSTLQENISFLGTTLFIVLLGIFVLIAIQLIRFETRQFRQQEYNYTLQALYDIREGLAGRIYANIYMVSSVNALASINPDFTQKDFEQAIEVQFKGDHDLRNIAISRDMVIQFIYPMEGNEAALGVNYNTLPDQIEAVNRAIDLSEIVVAGPVNLVQGGVGIVARIPIYIKGEFTGEVRLWGLTSAVMNIETLIVGAGVSEYQRKLRLALRGRDYSGALGAVFWGDAAVFDMNPLTQSVELPYGSWQIGAVPSAGWSTHYIVSTMVLWMYYIAAIAILIYTAVTLRLLSISKKTEDALRIAEERLGRTAYELTDNIPVGTYTIVQPPDGSPAKFNFMSRRFLELTGLEREDAAKDILNAFVSVHPEDYDDWVDLNVKCFEEKKPFLGITRIIINGEVRWAKAESTPRTLEDGTMVWEGVLTDITDEKHLEEQLISEKEKAEAANIAKGQFLANMSHEIRTPLNGLIGFTELLKRTPLSPIQQQYVNNANISGHTLLGIISDILDFSKIEAGKLELEYRKTDIPSLLQYTLEIVRFDAERKGLEILLNIDQQVPKYAVVDSVRLKQILSNLLSNAVKFTAEGEIELKLTCERIEGDRARLSFSVRDTGIGISDEQRNKLFNAFTQADSSTTRKFGGTGLGLAISEMIAGKMDSKIDFNSTLNKGTTFFFDIVTTVEVADSEDTIPLPRVKRCLIIDDNATSRQILENTLNQWGITCTLSSSGTEALRILEKDNKFDAIFCDFIMPEMDGMKTIRRMGEQLGLTPSKLPIILLHPSSADTELYQICDELGVVLRLTKPIINGNLLLLLSELGESENSTNVDKLTDLNIDKSSASNSPTPSSDITSDLNNTDNSVITAKKNPARSSNSDINIDISSKTTPASRSTAHSGTVVNQTSIAPAVPKILIAEDVSMNMILFRAILKNICKKAVIVEAFNGQEAVQKYISLEPDLILMDVQMPEMDGLNATIQIRAIEKMSGRHVPIIALTAGVLKEEQAKCFEAGMDYFLTKPVDSEKIKDILKKHNLLS